MQQSDVVKKLMLSRLRVLNRYGFYGLLLMQMSYGIDDECSTAYTDGKRICFSSKFLASLNNDEVDFVLMHEVLHVAFKHCFRGLEYDQYLFNIACDIVINSNILKANNMNLDKISVHGRPSMHLTPKGDEGHLYTAEEVYNMLLNHKKKITGNTLDDHSKWGELTPEEQENITQMVNEAIELSSNSVTGNVPNALLREFDELKNPKLSWNELINEILTYEVCDYTFSPPDRRYQDEYFLPDFNEYDYKEEEVHCYIDTSGSISKEELTDILSEINGALIQYNGKVIFKINFFDTEVYEAGDVASTSELLNLKPKGNGGTSFINVFKHIDKLEEKPKTVIILTDGYADFPKKDYSKEFPVIWLLCSDVTPPWGKFARYK